MIIDPGANCQKRKKRDAACNLVVNKNRTKLTKLFKFPATSREMKKDATGIFWGREGHANAYFAGN